MFFMYSLFFIITCCVIRATSSFSVFWNIPTETCHKFGFNFSEVEKYGLVQNKYDKFRGEKITIFYDPGMFPAIIGNADRNGAIPQEGNLTRHLIKLQKEVNVVIPDKMFSGVGIIDFEHWRPVWRENWGNLDVYRKRSIKTEKQKHPSWPRSRIEESAERRFEKAAYRFMEETLLMVRRLRPSGSWGYYAYPYCFNFTPKNPLQECTKQVIKDNDRSGWMFEGTALFPSIYMREKELNEQKRAKMISGRISEARRISSKQWAWKIKIFPYLAIKYQDSLKFLSKVDVTNGIKISKKSGSEGIFLWGSSKDTNSGPKCKELSDYLTKVIRPIMKQISDRFNQETFLD